MTCAKCRKRLVLVALCSTRERTSISSVTARYQCPGCPLEHTVDNRVPRDAALWRLYRGSRGIKRWHLWIEELASPTRSPVPADSACAAADLIAHPDRIIEEPLRGERVCQMCRCLAKKFEITLPKGASR